jgi:MFS family permease
MLQATAATAWAGIMTQAMPEWGMSASQAGLVQSAWHVGYLISLFFVGFVSDRIGPRRVFMAGSILTAAAMVLFAECIRGPVSAALLYGLVGLCAGGCYSPGLQLLSVNAAPQERGKSMGAFIGASSLGYGLSLLVVATFSAAMSLHSILLVVASMVTAGAILTLCSLSFLRPDVPRAGGNVGPSPGVILGETLRDKPAMVNSTAYAAHCWELMALWAWLPAYLVFAAPDGGLMPSQGIAMAAMSHVVSVAGSIIGGWASDRYGRTRVMMAATCSSLACSFAFGWMWAAPIWLLAIFGGLYNLCAIADSSIYSTSLADVVPPARLGAAFSVRSVMGFGAGAVSPWVFGLALDWGQAHFASPGNGWILAWATVGAGALIGPFMIHRFHLMTARAL